MLPFNTPSQVNSSIHIIPLVQVHSRAGQPHFFFKLRALSKLKECGHQPYNSVTHTISYSWTENSLFWNYNIAINTVVLEEL
jgi:hypothetical protein